MNGKKVFNPENAWERSTIINVFIFSSLFCSEGLQYIPAPCWCCGRRDSCRARCPGAWPPPPPAPGGSCRLGSPSPACSVCPLSGNYWHHNHHHHHHHYHYYHLSVIIIIINIIIIIIIIISPSPHHHPRLVALVPEVQTSVTRITSNRTKLSDIKERMDTTTPDKAGQWIVVRF